MDELLDTLSNHDLIVLLLRTYEHKIVVNGVLNADLLATVLERLFERNAFVGS